ncbi:MAG: RHS repeat-associated core domain-containing protein [Phycisphaerae bacterium]
MWYADTGGTGDAGQRVAAYAYDALFRRVSKTVSNQGLGCVHGSDAGGMAGIQAGDRAEHYFYSGWRLIEERDGADRTLAQTVFGTQYIDEPVCRDRNTDPVAGASPDSDCLDAGGSQRYFYHQDANYRVTLLTAESGGVVERYDYSAYGEPAVFGGAGSGSFESGAAMTVSTVGNPLMHQGLYRDGESGSYQNRYRQYGSGVGRWMQADPLGYVDSQNLREYVRSTPDVYLDAAGLQEAEPPSSQPAAPNPNVPAPDQPVPGVKHHLIPPRVNVRTGTIEEYGHGWIQVDGTSFGYWPSGVNDPARPRFGRWKDDPMDHDPKQWELENNKLSTYDKEQHQEVTWVFDPDKTFGHGPNAGRSCKGATVAEIKGCIRACAKSYATRHGPWRLPDNVCHQLPEECLGQCCLSR